MVEHGLIPAKIDFRPSRRTHSPWYANRSSASTQRDKAFPQGKNDKTSNVRFQDSGSATPKVAPATHPANRPPHHSPARPTTNGGSTNPTSRIPSHNNNFRTRTTQHPATQRRRDPSNRPPPPYDKRSNPRERTITTGPDHQSLKKKQRHPKKDVPQEEDGSKPTQGKSQGNQAPKKRSPRTSSKPRAPRPEDPNREPPGPEGKSRGHREPKARARERRARRTEAEGERAGTEGEAERPDQSRRREPSDKR